MNQFARLIYISLTLLFLTSCAATSTPEQEGVIVTFREKMKNIRFVSLTQPILKTLASYWLAKWSLLI